MIYSLAKITPPMYHDQTKSPAEFAAIAAEVRASCIQQIQARHDVQRWIRDEMDDIDAKMRVSRLDPEP